MKIAFAILMIAILTACSSTKIKSLPYYEVKYKGEFKAHILGTIHEGVTVEQVHDQIMNQFLKSQHVYLEFASSNESYGSSKLDPLSISDELTPIRQLLTTNEYATLRTDYEQYLNSTAPDNERIDEKQVEKSMSRSTPAGLLSVYQNNEKYKKYVDLALNVVYLNDNHKAEFMQEMLDIKLLNTAKKNNQNVYTLDNKQLCENEKYLLQQAPFLKLLKLAINRKDPKTYYTQMSAKQSLLGEESEQAHVKSNYQKLEDIIGNDPLEHSTKVAFKCILEERNQKWANFLDDYLPAGGSMFIAVGAAHLLPSKSFSSLIDYLRAKGYEVNKIEI